MLEAKLVVEHVQSILAHVEEGYRQLDTANQKLSSLLETSRG